MTDSGRETLIDSAVNCGTFRYVLSPRTGLPLVALVPQAMQTPIGNHGSTPIGSSFVVANSAGYCRVFVAMKDVALKWKTPARRPAISPPGNASRALRYSPGDGVRRASCGGVKTCAAGRCDGFSSLRDSGLVCRPFRVIARREPPASCALARVLASAATGAGIQKNGRTIQVGFAFLIAPRYAVGV